MSTQAMTRMKTSTVYRYISLATRQFTNERGRMCLYALRAEPKSVHEFWFNPRDQLAAAVAWAKKWNDDGFNMYMPWALFRKDSRTKIDMVASAAFVADWDEGRPRRVDGLVPTLTVETSRGRQQDIYVHAPGELGDVDVTYKKLARLFGCDVGPSGDPVHLWRVPGTMNWLNPKKKAAGRTPELATWNGKTGRVTDVLAHAGGGAKKSTATADTVDEWPRRRKGKPLTPKIRGWIRQKVQSGSRSEHMHKVVLAMCDLGWGVDDIIERLENSPCAEGRRDRLEYYVTASIGKFEGDPPNDTRDEDRPLFSDHVKRLNLADKDRVVEYLWEPYLVRGEVVMLDGASSSGKTSVMCRVSKDLVDGGVMPNGKRMRQGGHVLYVSVESDYHGFTLPLLRRMQVVGDTFWQHEDGQWALTDEGLPELEEFIKQHEIDLAVIDNLIDYMPVDGNRELMNQYGFTSAMINEIREIARRTNCCIVTIRHERKNVNGTSMQHRGIGSAGLAKGTRSQLTVMRDPEDPQDSYVLVHNKATYSKPGPSLRYSMQTVDGRGIVQWMGIDDRESEEIEAGTTPERKKARAEQRDEAKKWLAAFLKGKGAVNVSMIREHAETHSISNSTLHRAAHDLRVEAKTFQERGKLGKTSTWELLPD